MFVKMTTSEGLKELNIPDLELDETYEYEPTQLTKYLKTLGGLINCLVSSDGANQIHIRNLYKLMEELRSWGNVVSVGVQKLCTTSIEHEVLVQQLYVAINQARNSVIKINETIAKLDAGGSGQYAPKEHTHDDLYAPKEHKHAELETINKINTALNAATLAIAALEALVGKKAEKEHTHALADITDIETFPAYEAFQYFHLFYQIETQTEMIEIPGGGFEPHTIEIKHPYLGLKFKDIQVNYNGVAKSLLYHTHTINEITDYEPYDDTELRTKVDTALSRTEEQRNIYGIEETWAEKIQTAKVTTSLNATSTITGTIVTYDNEERLAALEKDKHEPYDDSELRTSINAQKTLIESVYSVSCNQQYFVMDKLVTLEANIVNMVYPVGSIYITTNNAMTDHVTLFLNTKWEQIRDRFIWCSNTAG